MYAAIAGIYKANHQQIIQVEAVWEVTSHEERSVAEFMVQLIYDSKAKLFF